MLWLRYQIGDDKMIYTITFNPSLDYIIQVDSFKTGTINKTKKEKILPGGKGINVSIVLSNLGHETTALGFLAGFTGKEIETRIKDFGCHSKFIQVKEGLSRINIKMKSDVETEINGKGPMIEREDVQKLFSYLDEIKKDDILVISGSIPHSLSDTIYQDIMKYLKDRQIKIVVDATKNLLLNVLKYHPFLIKPNHIELGEIFNVKISNQKEAIFFAKKLQKLGAKNVLVSMANQGAILVDSQHTIHQSAAPKGTVINSVGAGDSMVAGFISGYLNSSGNFEKAFKTGICAGSASAFSENLATKEEIQTLLKKTL